MAGDTPKEEEVPGGILPRDAMRVAAVVKRIEHQYGNAPAPRGRYQGRLTQTQIARTGSAIAAMAGSTPNSGTVTLHYFDGTDLVAGDDITAYSNWTTAIGANHWIHVTLIDGEWFVCAEDCS